tara:strand:- start:14645 stop:14884 length:240 start_codon:yes stop_codon:yes gene_type:complete
MSKELDDLIKEKGWRKGQQVKLGYEDIENFANQRATEELRSIHLDIPMGMSGTILYLRLNNLFLKITKRINELNKGKDE